MFTTLKNQWEYPPDDCNSQQTPNDRHARLPHHSVFVPIVHINLLLVLFQQRYVKSHREERKFPTTSEPKYRDFLTRWRDRYGISPFFSLNLLAFLPQNEIPINPFRRKSSFNRCISLTIKTLRSVLFRNTHASDSHG